MKGEWTDSQSMARKAGLSNGRAFRKKLRADLADVHTPNNWKVEVGSPKHARMAEALKELMAGLKR